MTSAFNPLSHPVLFSSPRRLTLLSASREHIPFAMFLVDLLRPKVVVELGTQYGDIYLAFCQAVQELGLSTRCYAIGTWKDDPHAGFQSANILSELKAHHDILYGSFSSIINSTFDDALEHFSTRSIDILHIDRHSTYEAVKHDFESWLPRMTDRGIVLIHDINFREGGIGVWKLWEEVAERYPYFEFVHGRGLGVVAIGKKWPAELAELFEVSGEDILKLRSFFFQLGQQLTSKAEHLAQLTAERERSGREASELQSTLREQRQVLAEKEEQLAYLARERDRLMQEAIQLQATIQEQQRALAQKNEEVNRLGKERDVSVQERASLQAALQSVRQELVSIKDTIGWKVLDKYRRVRAESQILSSIHAAFTNPIKKLARKRSPSVQEKDGLQASRPEGSAPVGSLRRNPVMTTAAPDAWNIPIFVISFNRLTALQRCICSYKRFTPASSIYIIDMGSDYAPLLSYYSELQSRGSTIFFAGSLRGNNADALNIVSDYIESCKAKFSSAYYAVTDPDISLESAKDDALALYAYLLDQYPSVKIAGPMLRISDIPPDYPAREFLFKRQIGLFWHKIPRSVAWKGKTVYFQFAPIDTTFGLVRSSTVYRRLLDGIRVYYPYEALHLDWYLSDANMTQDQIHYIKTANPDNARWPMTHWGGPWFKNPPNESWPVTPDTPVYFVVENQLGEYIVVSKKTAEIS